MSRLSIIAIISLFIISGNTGYTNIDTKQKKLYISTITVEGFPATMAKQVRNVIEIAIFENFKEYRVITDDDVKVMYKKAEALMASGCNAESCQQQIADAIDADCIIYGEITRKNNEILFKGKRLDRNKKTLEINVGSIVQYMFPEQDSNYYLAEIAKKLINANYLKLNLFSKIKCVQ